MNIIITADLHLHPRLTPEPLVKDFLQALPHCDLFIVAGDLGERGGWFEKCLPLLDYVDAGEVAVLLGNHDLWTDDPDELTSEKLWVSVLPDLIRKHDFTYLEDKIIRLNHTAVIGTIAWYDYSIDRELDWKKVRADKSLYNNDGNFMTKWDDLDFSEKCHNRLRQRLVELEKDNSVKQIVVVTHVPIFKEQHITHPGDSKIADAYFYNITLGNMVRNFTKVSHVVSGHTHRSVDLKVGNIQVSTVDSDYASPGYVEIDFDA